MPLVLVVAGRCEKSLFGVVIPREFPGAVTNILDADGDSKVVSAAGRLTERISNTPIFLRDLDEYPCRTALRSAFGPNIPAENIIIVYPCLEAWYLADEEAVNRQFSRLANGNPKGRQYQKTVFATSFAQHFSLRRAATRSSSARRLVARIEAG